jgi:hypothetical protein
MKKKEKNIIKCLSTTVQIFSKAAQAQLREKAYDYKAVWWDMYHKVVSALVVSCGTLVGEAAGSTPAGCAIYYFAIPDSFQVGQRDLPVRSVDPVMGPTRQIGPLVRCCRTRPPDPLDPQWDLPARSIYW